MAHHSTIKGSGLLDAAYFNKILGRNPIAYWPLWETAGLTARCLVNSAQNGTYTGATLGQDGIGDGNTAPLFDGINDFCNMQTATLASNFDGAEGTIIMWVIVSGAGIWTDGVLRSACEFRASVNNRVTLYKHPNNNTFIMGYIAGGVARSATVITSTTAWFHCAITWSATANETRFFIDGTQTGATQVPGVWAGNLATSVIGAINTVPNNVWSGRIAHAAFFDSALAPATIAALATP